MASGEQPNSFIKYEAGCASKIKLVFGPESHTFAAFKSHHFDQTRRRKAGFVPPLASSGLSLPDFFRPV